MSCMRGAIRPVMIVDIECSRTIFSDDGCAKILESMVLDRYSSNSLGIQSKAICYKRHRYGHVSRLQLSTGRSREIHSWSS